MESVWTSEINFRKRESLSENIECDIVVIGAGMAGILIAYMLSKSGKEVIVIDAKSIAGGVTKNTTAKITCQHDLIYDKLIKEFGEEGARQYAKANELAIFGGVSHRSGENEKGGAYEKLREEAKRLYPNSIERYHWSAQDCITLDNIPYIGHYSTKTPNIYVATGFKKWGMTSSMVSAMIISDMILGKENDFSEIFSPKRFDMSLSMKNAANDIAKTVKNFIAQRISIPEEHLGNIQKGHGGIIEYKGEKVGVYKDNGGSVFTVSTKCAHLGCELHWNSDELTWDCPCHGSRYDYKGNWIESPTNKSLQNIY